jgi:cell division protein ZapE
MSAVRILYEQTLAERGFQSDAAQLVALAALERCETEWADYKARRSNALTKLIRSPPIPRGVYMWGGVGRGKSFLMDCFFQAVPLTRKTRLHFHEFMREVHRELQDLKGTVNPLDELGRRMARRHRLICFDEFHVADVTDAMILHRLLQSLFDNRVSIVTTSNFHPDGLYPNGLHRDRILPAIELLKAHLEVINVDAGTDYRQLTPGAGGDVPLPLGPEADALMSKRPSTAWPKRATRTRCCTSSTANCRPDAAPVAWCGSTSAPVRRAAVAERLPRTRLALPHGAAVQRATDAASRWPARRAASPGWWTCCTTGA